MSPARDAGAMSDPATSEAMERESGDPVLLGTVTVDPAAVRWSADGLLPCIVQDAADRTVLMLGYMDAEALAATFDSGLVHFRSRSRGRLWRKGEKSGNVLRLRWMALDCDADALLVGADPAGPTCHTGARSCFGEPFEPRSARGPAPVGPGAEAGSPESAAGGVTAAGVRATSPGFAWIETLWSTIVDRRAHRPPGSYTAQLLDGGVDAAARKVVEEATEVLMAAKDDAVSERDAAGRRFAAIDPTAVRERTRAALAAEMADLIFHELVLLAERGLEPGDVIEVLRGRHTR